MTRETAEKVSKRLKDLKANVEKKKPGQLILDLGS